VPLYPMSLFPSFVRSGTFQFSCFPFHPYPALPFFFPITIRVAPTVPALGQPHDSLLSDCIISLSPVAVFLLQDFQITASSATHRLWCLKTFNFDFPSTTPPITVFPIAIFPKTSRMPNLSLCSCPFLCN